MPSASCSRGLRPDSGMCVLLRRATCAGMEVVLGRAGGGQSAGAADGAGQSWGGDRDRERGRLEGERAAGAHGDGEEEHHRRVPCCPGGHDEPCRGYASVVHLDDAVGAPQGGPHLPQACKQRWVSGGGGGGGSARPAPTPHLSPCAPGTRRSHRGRRNRSAPGTRPAPARPPAPPGRPAAPRPGLACWRRPVRCVTSGRRGACAA